MSAFSRIRPSAAPSSHPAPPAEVLPPAEILLAVPPQDALVERPWQRMQRLAPSPKQIVLPIFDAALCALSALGLTGAVTHPAEKSHQTRLWSDPAPDLLPFVLKVLFGAYLGYRTAQPTRRRMVLMPPNLRACQGQQRRSAYIARALFTALWGTHAFSFIAKQLLFFGNTLRVRALEPGQLQELRSLDRQTIPDDELRRLLIARISTFKDVQRPLTWLSHSVAAVNSVPQWLGAAFVVAHALPRLGAWIGRRTAAPEVRPTFTQSAQPALAQAPHACAQVDRVQNPAPPPEGSPHLRASGTLCASRSAARSADQARALLQAALEGLRPYGNKASKSTKHSPVAVLRDQECTLCDQLGALALLNADDWAQLTVAKHDICAPMTLTPTRLRNAWQGLEERQNSHPNGRLSELLQRPSSVALGLFCTQMDGDGLRA